MDTEYIQEFIKIIREQNDTDKKNVSKITIEKIDTIILKDNNLIGILCNIDTIDIELNDVSFWIKNEIYNKIFSSELYNAIVKKIHDNPEKDPNYEISKDEYFKLMLYGGFNCEIIKIGYYNNIIEVLEQENSKNLVKKAFKETFIKMRDNGYKFIKQLYLDVIKYFHNDEIFTDVNSWIKESELEKYVL